MAALSKMDAMLFFLKQIVEDNIFLKKQIFFKKAKLYII